MAVSEEEIDALFNEIQSEEKEKTASQKVEPDQVAESLRKTASQLRDAEDQDEMAIDGTVTVESDSPSKQALKEKLLLGIKNDQSDKTYKKLRNELIETGPVEEEGDEIDKVAEALAEAIANGEL